MEATMRDIFCLVLGFRELIRVRVYDHVLAADLKQVLGDRMAQWVIMTPHSLDLYVVLADAQCVGLDPSHPDYAKLKAGDHEETEHKEARVCAVHLLFRPAFERGRQAKTAPGYALLRLRVVHMHPPTIISTFQRPRGEDPKRWLHYVVVGHGRVFRTGLYENESILQLTRELKKQHGWRGAAERVQLYLLKTGGEPDGAWMTHKHPDVQELAVGHGWRPAYLDDRMRLHQDRMVGTDFHGACLEDVVAVVVQLPANSPELPQRGSMWTSLLRWPSAKIMPLMIQLFQATDRFCARGGYVFIVDSLGLVVTDNVNHMIGFYSQLKWTVLTAMAQAQLLARRWTQTAIADDTEALRAIHASTGPSLVDVAHPEHERTALMLAVAWNACDAVALLLDLGADITRSDPEGATALHLAVANDASDSLRVLLDHLTATLDAHSASSLVNQRNRVDATPLHMAASIGATACCRLLLASDLADASLLWSSLTPRCSGRR
ncbi:hypothetical protein Poli38472_012838 [Pythium oligandrum]|uniref:Uncharacterized protein n=1 Tax=Pythium oligandrum TaxID=41045 RepID=A0A8K1FIU6_PYTOL|nr:hypothetical protein Poli38472_012838 [Pythium oligandrum]|eukprot:TMW64216.1 hypothetical protein Poli38472_012838 [Pythium oligandrum]